MPSFSGRGARRRSRTRPVVGDNCMTRSPPEALSRLMMRSRRPCRTPWRWSATLLTGYVLFCAPHQGRSEVAWGWMGCPRGCPAMAPRAIPHPAVCSLSDPHARRFPAGGVSHIDSVTPSPWRYARRGLRVRPFSMRRAAARAAGRCHVKAAAAVLLLSPAGWVHSEQVDLSWTNACRGCAGRAGRDRPLHTRGRSGTQEEQHCYFEDPARVVVAS